MGDLSKILNRNQSGGGPEMVSQVSLQYACQVCVRVIHGLTIFVSQLRIRGQTFAQSYLVDQSNYQRAQDMTSPQMYKPMQAPPSLSQAFPAGAPLDRQREEQLRLQQEQQMMLQQQQQQQQQPPRQYAPPPSMAQFQAQVRRRRFFFLFLFDCSFFFPRSDRVSFLLVLDMEHLQCVLQWDSQCR